MYSIVVWPAAQASVAFELDRFPEQLEAERAANREAVAVVFDADRYGPRFYVPSLDSPTGYCTYSVVPTGAVRAACQTFITLEQQEAAGGQCLPPHFARH